jgi:pimeloyl-ACP methyl ester carboxylesterase
MDSQFMAAVIIALLAVVISWFVVPSSWARLLLAIGRLLAGLRSRTIEVDGQHWHYLEGGQGPALVALHGFGADADHWLRVAPLLRKRFHIVAPDLIGFGTSSPGERLPFDIASQAQRLGRLLDAIGIDRCILAGNSMGGWIATRFAADHPERVAALWLLAPLGVKNCQKGELLDAIDQGRESPMTINSLRDFDRRVYRPMFARAPWLPYPLRIYYGRDALRRRSAAVRMFGEVRDSAEPLEDTAARIAAPVLLPWGDLDRAVHVSGAAALASVVPGIEVQRQPGIGHLPMLEAAGVSARGFLDFAGRHALDVPAGR